MGPGKGQGPGHAFAAATRMVIAPYHHAVLARTVNNRLFFFNFFFIFGFHNSRFPLFFSGNCVLSCELLEGRLELLLAAVHASVFR